MARLLNLWRNGGPYPLPNHGLPSSMRGGMELMSYA